MASSWFLFFSYHNVSRSNKHQTTVQFALTISTFIIVIATHNCNTLFVANITLRISATLNNYILASPADTSAWLYRGAITELRLIIIIIIIIIMIKK